MDYGQWTMDNGQWTKDIKDGKEFKVIKAASGQVDVLIIK
jgi:hypothetical protein